MLTRSYVSSIIYRALRSSGRGCPRALLPQELIEAAEVRPRDLDAGDIGRHRNDTDRVGAPVASGRQRPNPLQDRLDFDYMFALAQIYRTRHASHVVLG